MSQTCLGVYAIRNERCSAKYETLRDCMSPAVIRETSTLYLAVRFLSRVARHREVHEKKARQMLPARTWPCASCSGAPGTAVLPPAQSRPEEHPPLPPPGGHYSCTPAEQVLTSETWVWPVKYCAKQPQQQAIALLLFLMYICSGRQKN